MLSIFKYSNNFPDRYNQEKEKLNKIIKVPCLIEHVGSTAIPNVDGKGVIDILIVFNKLIELDKSIDKLKKAGYFLDESGKERKGRIFMSSSGSKESALGDVHLHVFEKNNEGYKEMILFRNILRNNLKLRQEYVDLKYKIYNEVEGNRKKYTELKIDFINKVLEAK